MASTIYSVCCNLINAISVYIIWIIRVYCIVCGQNEVTEPLLKILRSLHISHMVGYFLPIIMAQQCKATQENFYNATVKYLLLCETDNLSLEITPGY